LSIPFPGIDLVFNGDDNLAAATAWDLQNDVQAAAVGAGPRSVSGFYRKLIPSTFE
jgi:hypothetical protein